MSASRWLIPPASLPRGPRIWLSAVALTVGQPGWTLAQAPAEKGGVERSEAGAARGYTFEGVVVVLLLGLALFSVCRTSRRV